MSTHTLDFSYTDEEGTEITEALPAIWEICDTCSGDGHHCQHLGAITESEFSQWDQDEVGSYFSGGYDKTCEECKGKGKVLAFNLDAISSEMQKLIFEAEEEDRRDRMERESERRMGA